MKKITFLVVLLMSVSFLQAQVNLEDFEGTAPTVNLFDGFGSATVVTDPVDAGNQALELITSATGNAWQGAELILQGDKMDLTNATGSSIVTAMVYSPDAIDILAKVDKGVGGAGAVATDASHPGGGWQMLSFNFDNTRDPNTTPAVDGVYGSIVFFPLWNSLGGTCFNGCYSPYGTPGVSEMDTILVDDITAVSDAVDPMTDATLSDLQVDGVTVGGFDSAITSYSYSVPSGTVVVPQITTATTTNPSATRVITQAPGIPGDATVEVTAENGSTMMTYTVSIVEEGPAISAPVPPNRPAADVVAIFSDAYPSSNISVDTFDTNWCPATTSDVMIAGNPTKKITGLGCEGIEFITGRFDPTALGLTHVHIDIFTETATMDKSFNMKFSNWNNGGGENNGVEFSATNASTPPLPNPNPGTWISFDIPLADWSAGLRNDFVQFVITSDLGTIWYDNFYLHKNTVLSNDEFNQTSFKVFPNPSEDNWTVTTQSEHIEAISVYDVLGKQVLRTLPSAQEAQIDGSALKSGIYFARISTANGLSTIRLVKK